MSSLSSIAASVSIARPAPTRAPTAPITTAAFDHDVKTYATLEEQIAALSNQVKTLKKQQQTIGTGIVRYMQEHEVDKCDIDDSPIRLSLCESVGQSSLSIPLLKTVFDQFFARKPEISARLIDAIQLYRKESAGIRTRLKKIKKRGSGNGA